MAIIKLGTIITGIRGTIGGTVFSGNASGAYAKLWKAPSNPKSNLQTVQRGAFSSMPALWRLLTPAQKADWSVFAALPAQELTNSLGEAYYASGWNWFVTLNTRLLSLDMALLTDAPIGAKPAAPTITDVVFTEDAGLPTLNVEYGAGEFTDLAIIVNASFVAAGGRQVQYSDYYLVKQAWNPGASPFDCSLEFRNRWGTAGEGDTLFVRVQAQSDEGQRSTEYAIMTTYTV